MMIANITYKDVDTLYEKLRIPVGRTPENAFDNMFFRNDGDSVSTDRTYPYDEFVDIVCISES